MKKKGHSKNMFVKIIASPIKALGKARDMYVRSITKCGNSMSYGNYPMDDAGSFSSFSRSYSVATSTRSSVSSDEDFAELMRVASARTLGNKIDVDLVLKQQNQNQNQNKKNHKGLPKSSSVGMARIDEEKPYDPEGSVGSVLQDLYSRSRSYAVTKRNNKNVFSD